MVVCACIVCDGEHVGYGVRAESCLLDGELGEAVHLVVDEGGGFEFAELAVALELVDKGLGLASACHEVAEVCHGIVQGLPLQVVDAAWQRLLAVVFGGPGGVCVVVARCDPPAGPVVEPERAVACVSGGEDCCLACRGDGVDEAYPVAGNLQLVADGGDGECPGRGLLVGEDAGVVVVVHAEDGPELLPVEPVCAGDAVVVWACACHEAGHGGGFVGRTEGIFSLRVEATLFLEPLEASLPVERGEGIHVVAAELVDDDVHHERRNALGLLGLGARHGEQGDERGEEEPSPASPEGMVVAMVLHASAHRDDFLCGFFFTGFLLPAMW